MRRCPICKTPLCERNENKYCFAHSHQGALLEDEKYRLEQKKKTIQKMKKYYKENKEKHKKKCLEIWNRNKIIKQEQSTEQAQKSAD